MTASATPSLIVSAFAAVTPSIPVDMDRPARRSRRKALATPAGLEPATCRLEGGCSIQLSYGAERNGPTRPHLALQCDHGTIRFGAKLSE